MIGMDLIQGGEERSLKTDRAQEAVPVLVDPLTRVPGNLAQVEAASGIGGRATPAGGETMVETRQFFKSTAAVIRYPLEFPEDEAIRSHAWNIDLYQRFLSTGFRSCA